MAFRQDEHRVSRSCESGCARYRVKRVLWLVPLIRVMQSKDGKLSAVGEVLQRWQRPIIRLIGGVVLTTLRADLSKNVDNYQTGMLDAVAPFFDSFGAAVVKTSAASTWHSKHFGIDSKPPLGKGRYFFFLQLLIKFYTGTTFSGNDLTQKSPEIFNLRPLDNICPRARAQERRSSVGAFDSRSDNVSP